MNDKQIEKALGSLMYTPDEYIENIRKILKACRHRLTGKYTEFGSGGGFEHIYFQLEDKTWIGFNYATDNITVSAVAFEDTDEIYEAFWDEDDQVKLNKYFIPSANDESPEYWENWAEIADDINAKKYSVLIED